MTKQDNATPELTAAALAEIDSVHESVQVLNQRMSAIKSARASIAAEVLELRTRALSRADIKAFALGWIDECAAQYEARANLASIVDKFATPQRKQHHPERDPLSIDHIDAITGKGGNALAMIGSDSFEFFYSADNVGTSSYGRLYFFFGDAIKAKVSAAFDARFSGLPAESAAVSESLDSRRTKLADLAVRDAVLAAEEGDINSRLVSLRSAIQRA